MHTCNRVSGGASFGPLLACTLYVHGDAESMACENRSRKSLRLSTSVRPLTIKVLRPWITCSHTTPSPSEKLQEILLGTRASSLSLSLCLAIVCITIDIRDIRTQDWKQCAPPIEC